MSRRGIRWWVWRHREGEAGEPGLVDALGPVPVFGTVRRLGASRPRRRAHRDGRIRCYFCWLLQRRQAPGDPRRVGPHNASPHQSNPPAAMTSRCTRSSPALSSLRASTTVRARWTRRPRCTSNGPGRYGWRLGRAHADPRLRVGSGHPNIAYRRGCVAEPSAPSAPGRHRRYRRAANRSWRGYSRAHTVRTRSAGACTGSDGRRGAGAAAT